MIRIRNSVKLGELTENLKVSWRRAVTETAIKLNQNSQVVAAALSDPHLG